MMQRRGMSKVILWIGLGLYFLIGVGFAFLYSILHAISGTKPPLWQALLVFIAWPLYAAYILIIKRLLGW